MKGTKTRPKARALTAVPQSREEAVGAIARVGLLRGRIEAAKARADEAVRRIGEELERDVAQLVAELADTETGLQTWCEAHRDELTGGRGKTVEFGSGRVLWRARPPKVTLRNVEGVLESCKRLGLGRFIRTKEEVNKEAMLAEPEVARTLAGVSIGSVGEDFVIEPAELPVALGA